MPLLRVLRTLAVMPVFGLIVFANGCGSANDKVVGKDTAPDQFKAEGAARAKAYGGSTIPQDKAPSANPEAAARRRGGSR